MHGIITYITKLLLFAVVISLMLVLLGKVFERSVDYRRLQDPRARILWDSDYDGSSIVLIGNSVFGSYYVDSADQTIWQRMERLCNKKVFPASLNGAKGIDVLLVSRHISKSWPKDTTVFVSIIPTTFINNKDKHLLKNVPVPFNGNYDKKLSTFILYYDDKDSFYDKMHKTIVYYVCNNFYLLRNREIVESYFNNKTIPIKYYNIGNDHNRIWNVDGSFARNNYDAFEYMVDLKKQIYNFKFIQEIAELFRNSGMKVVFVLTPLNKKLVYEYAKTENSVTVINKLETTHRELLSYLNTNRLNYVDIYDKVEANGFADMIHTNVCGDEIMAENMATWVVNNNTTKIANR